MKSASKLDQLRAMREANHQPATLKSIAVKRLARKMGAQPASADQPGAAPWLAPVGQCASCDKRRAQLQVTMRKRRAKSKAL